MKKKEEEKNLVIAVAAGVEENLLFSIFFRVENVVASSIKQKDYKKKKPKFKPNRRLRLAEKTEKLKWVMKNCKECECRTTKES